MTTNHKKQIDQLYFHLDQPTELTFVELHNWVIWQFPHLYGDALCGAVHPPISGYGWLPALVQPLQARVVVYAHQEQKYVTPEAAADTFS